MFPRSIKKLQITCAHQQPQTPSSFPAFARDVDNADHKTEQNFLKWHKSMS